MKLSLRKVGTFAPILTFLILFIFFVSISDSFRTMDNFTNILQQNSGLAIMAVGVTFVLLCAEIDLSIAFMATLAGVLSAYVFVTLQGTIPGFWAQFIAILAAVVASAALGYLSGFGTAYIGLPSFMMTLAMFLITKGLALRITLGEPIFEIPPLLDTLGTGSINLVFFEMPNITLVATAFLLAGFVILRYTRFGRYVYMVGGNRQAAELAGINVKGVTTACLCICGLTAGISGVVLTGRMGSAQAEGLDSMLINCISAVVLGGTSLFGGKGGIPNTIVGLLTFGVLYNGLNHVDINIYLKEFISGVILLAALVLNVTMARIRTAD